MNFKLPEGNVLISFSGGRTSGYMLHQILEENGDLPDRVKVTFANTGREMPETLDFVQECSDRWNVKINWIEYSRRSGRVGFDVVNHNSASRNGEPLEEMIRASKYIPNTMRRKCTQETKLLTIKGIADLLAGKVGKTLLVFALMKPTGLSQAEIKCGKIGFRFLMLDYQSVMLKISGSIRSLTFSFLSSMGSHRIQTVMAVF
jgi:hypothetical protein